MWSILIVFSINMLFASPDRLVTEIQLHRNDSVFRHTYLYDQQKRVLLETRSLRKSSDWVNVDQTEWIYYENKPEVQIGRKWKESKWIDEYVIKESRRGDILIEEHFAGTAAIENLNKTTICLFENGLLKNKTSRRIVNGNAVLIDSVMYNYNLGKLSTETHHIQKPNGMYSRYMFDYKYNEAGNPVSMIEKAYVNDTLWQARSEVQWFYKPGTTLVSSERFRKCDSVTGVWENSKMQIYRYDEAKRLVEEVYFYWNSMVWEKNLRYVYKYDDRDMLLAKHLSLPVYSEWRNTVNIRYLTTANHDVEEIESVYGFWGGNAGDPVNSRIPYNFNGEMQIAYGQKMQITYSEVNNIETNNKSNQAALKVFPNPSSGVFYYNPAEFETDNWTVYDVSGRVIKTQMNGAVTGVIDLSDQPNAVYFLRARAGDIFLNIKLIKYE